jgi:antitoxin component HigA of HigAB toxin-antitoxin module
MFLPIKNMIGEPGRRNKINTQIEEIAKIWPGIQNIPEVEGNPSDTLKTLMEEHNLKQSNLPEIGSQGVISEILSGKLQLNVRQIKLLSKRFNVSPAVFM